MTPIAIGGGLVLGVVIGIISGMLGIGGGAFLIPAVQRQLLFPVVLPQTGMLPET